LQGYSKLSGTKFHVEWDLEDGFDKISGRSDSVMLVEGEDKLYFTSIIQFTAQLVARNVEESRFKPKYITFMLVAVRSPLLFTGDSFLFAYSVNAILICKIGG
jgi:hypothetical protein